jgi:hypothetical protein
VLTGINFIKLSDSTWKSFISNFSHIRSLFLNGCIFETTQKFLSFFAPLTHLEALELHCSGANEDPRGTDENIPRHFGSPFRLRSLSLGHTSSVSGIVDSLVLSGAISSLHTFQMCDSSLTDDEVASVGRLLLNVGPALEHLELGLWSVGKHSNCKFS